MDGLNIVPGARNLGRRESEILVGCAGNQTENITAAVQLGRS